MKLRLAGFLIGSLLAAGGACASPQLNGSVKELWINDTASTNVAYILVGNTPFSSSCGATAGYLVIDLSQQDGRAAYAMALSAFIAGRSVRAAGIDTCYGQTEKLKWIYMVQ